MMLFTAALLLLLRTEVVFTAVTTAGSSPRDSIKGPITIDPPIPTIPPDTPQIPTINPKP